MIENILKGDLIVKTDTTVEYTTVGGYVYVLEGVKLSAPQLTTIGGSVYGSLKGTK